MLLEKGDKAVTESDLQKRFGMMRSRCYKCFLFLSVCQPLCLLADIQPGALGWEFLLTLYTRVSLASIMQGPHSPSLYMGQCCARVHTVTWMQTANMCWCICNVAHTQIWDSIAKTVDIRLLPSQTRCASAFPFCINRYENSEVRWMRFKDGGRAFGLEWMICLQRFRGNKGRTKRERWGKKSPDLIFLLLWLHPSSLSILCSSASNNQVYCSRPSLFYLCLSISVSSKPISCPIRSSPAYLCKFMLCRGSPHLQPSTDSSLLTPTSLLSRSLCATGCPLSPFYCADSKAKLGTLYGVCMFWSACVCVWSSDPLISVRRNRGGLVLPSRVRGRVESAITLFHWDTHTHARTHPIPGRHAQWGICFQTISQPSKKYTLAHKERNR